MAQAPWDRPWLAEGKPLSHSWVAVIIVSGMAALFLIGFTIVRIDPISLRRRDQDPNQVASLSTIITNNSPDIYTQRRQTFYRRQAQLREQKLARTAIAPLSGVVAAESPRGGRYAPPIAVSSQESLPAYSRWEDIPLRPVSPEKLERGAMTDPLWESKPRWTGSGWYVGTGVVERGSAAAAAVDGQEQREETRWGATYGVGGERKWFT